MALIMNIHWQFWLVVFFYGAIGFANLALAEVEIKTSPSNAQCQAATYDTLNLKNLPDDPDVVAKLILNNNQKIILIASFIVRTQCDWFRKSHHARNGRSFFIFSCILV
jgi:hypothetical protein